MKSNHNESHFSSDMESHPVSSLGYIGVTDPAGAPGFTHLTGPLLPSTFNSVGCLLFACSDASEGPWYRRAGSWLVLRLR